MALASEGVTDLFPPPPGEEETHRAAAGGLTTWVPGCACEVCASVKREQAERLASARRSW